MANTNVGYPLTSIEFMIFQAIGYNAACWIFTKYMEKREPLNTKTLTQVHNLAMSLFSLILTVVFLVETYKAGYFESLDSLLCNPPRTPAVMMLFYLFYLSKLWEMLDTFILIANKKKVIWLHQIHHTSTLSLMGCAFYGSVGHDFIPVIENLVVHTFMYTYYYNPRYFAAFRQLMTSSQIFQFINVLCLCAFSWYLYFFDYRRCNDSIYVLIYETFWYLIYLVLFTNFFIQQYTNKKPHKELSLIHI
eukprot:TRINITY_DN1517_c0_g1_i2.p1 TRINITY_DN1517_c0_g1~~TRINITY_DN1517_c0_g1_i2.p1  ORF type:complete len:248 (-),score=9.91 TRINITY_DN1517_c0_g1_i2:24-767(-)